VDSHASSGLAHFDSVPSLVVRLMSRKRPGLAAGFSNCAEVMLRNLLQLQTAMIGCGMRFHCLVGAVASHLGLLHNLSKISAPKNSTRSQPRRRRPTPQPPHRLNTKYQQLNSGIAPSAQNTSHPTAFRHEHRPRLASTRQIPAAAVSANGSASPSLRDSGIISTAPNATSACNTKTSRLLRIPSFWGNMRRSLRKRRWKPFRGSDGA
jgi:hypothetical protein